MLRCKNITFILLFVLFIGPSAVAGPDDYLFSVASQKFHEIQDMLNQRKQEILDEIQRKKDSGESVDETPTLTFDTELGYDLLERLSFLAALFAQMDALKFLETLSKEKHGDIRRSLEKLRAELFSAMSKNKLAARTGRSTPAEFAQEWAEHKHTSFQRVHDRQRTRLDDLVRAYTLAEDPSETSSDRNVLAVLQGLAESNTPLPGMTEFAKYLLGLSNDVERRNALLKYVEKYSKAIVLAHSLKARMLINYVAGYDFDRTDSSAKPTWYAATIEPRIKDITSEIGLTQLQKRKINRILYPGNMDVVQGESPEDKLWYQRREVQLAAVLTVAGISAWVLYQRLKNNPWFRHKILGVTLPEYKVREIAQKYASVSPAVLKKELINYKSSDQQRILNLIKQIKASDALFGG